MAHKKGQGSTKNGRDSESKRLGVKLFGGQSAIPGNIIVRQRGTKYHPGLGVGMGKDHTIFSKVEGVVSFTKKRNNRTFISVLPLEEISEKVAKTPKKVETLEVADVKVAKKEATPKKETAAKKESKATKKAAAPKKKDVTAEIDKDATKASLLGTLGSGDESTKDDLKKIIGVGPKLESTLNSIGIYTFEQVSKMTDGTYDQLDDLLDSFKGRAKRDDWAGQAKELMN